MEPMKDDDSCVDWPVPDQLTEDKLRALIRFMAQLGRLTRKRVVMTPENASHLPIFEYVPARNRVRFRRS